MSTLGSSTLGTGSLGRTVYVYTSSESVSASDGYSDQISYGHTLSETVSASDSTDADYFGFTPGYSWKTEEALAYSIQADSPPISDVTMYEQSTTSDDLFRIELLSSGELRIVYKVKGSIEADLNPSVNVCDGSWHRVLVQNPSGDFKAYIDGSLEASETSTFNSGLGHGKIQWNGGVEVDIDEFKRWKTTLSGTEIPNDASGSDVASSDLFLHWSFDTDPERTETIIHGNNQYYELLYDTEFYDEQGSTGTWDAGAQRIEIRPGEHVGTSAISKGYDVDSFNASVRATQNRSNLELQYSTDGGQTYQTGNLGSVTTVSSDAESGLCFRFINEQSNTGTVVLEPEVDSAGDFVEAAIMIDLEPA